MRTDGGSNREGNRKTGDAMSENINPNCLLKALYQNAEKHVSKDELSKVSPSILPFVEEVIHKAEGAKAVLTVLLTSAVYKKLYPEQDIRLHQAGIAGGYSGRTFDTQFITPFLREKQFPAMAESGWLTRSLEQKKPYNADYPGAIRPNSLKKAFLSLIDYVEQAEPSDLDSFISYILERLIQEREKHSIILAYPQNLTIQQILHLIQEHFQYKYQFDGVSRLPTLAIYAAYEVLINELRRYHGRLLLPLENHTSADRKSGRMGDINVVNADGSAYESVEVKYGIPINLSMLNIAYEKFKGASMQRYYLLSTGGVESIDSKSVNDRINDIRSIHGCQVIINGISSTLTYYLRLMTDPADFIRHYVNNLATDSTIKYEHKTIWNNLVESLLRERG